MIEFRAEPVGCLPVYMTEGSAAADLFARTASTIKPNEVALVPTGVWIQSVRWDLIPKDRVGELQIRARSGLSFKQGLMLANGVGTVDLDYRDEIGVLLFNSRGWDYQVNPGDRIAQILLAIHPRIPNLKTLDEKRVGGFGSTSRSSILNKALST